MKNGILLFLFQFFYGALKNPCNLDKATTGHGFAFLEERSVKGSGKVRANLFWGIPKRRIVEDSRGSRAGMSPMTSSPEPTLARPPEHATKRM